jgi:hypothetical protein
MDYWERWKNKELLQCEVRQLLCVFYVVRAEQRWNNGVMQPNPSLSNGSVNTIPRKR